jgi:hypothetical protein
LQGFPIDSKDKSVMAIARILKCDERTVRNRRDRSTGKTLTKVLPSRTAKDIGKALVPALAMDVVLSSVRRVSQAWYLSPKRFDEKRFSSGMGSIRVYDIRYPRGHRAG